MSTFQALIDPCRGGEQDDPDDDEPNDDDRAAMIPDEPRCGCCGAPEGQPCDEAVHRDYDEALTLSMCEPSALAPCTTWSDLDALRYELGELGPARPIPPDPKRAVRVEEIVAWRVLDRWAAAGVTRAYVDAQGAPTPLLGEPEHQVQVVQGRTSPSGKTLFTCARCAEPERPVPPHGPCRGVAVHSLLYPVRDFLAAGGRFQPDAAGILRPVARA